MVAAAFFISIAQADARADDICSAVASHIRAGEADGPNMVIRTLASNARPLVRLASGDSAVSQILTKVHATPKLVQAAKSQFGDDFGSASVSWLGSSGAGAIKATVGTASCTEMVFFDSHDGQAHEVAPPTDMSFGEATVCWNEAAWIGTLGAVPVLIEEDDGNTSAGASASLRFVPWQDHRWGPTCRISATFTTSLAVTGASCRKGVDCGAMQSQALKLAQGVDAEARNGGTTNADTANVPQRLGDLASRTPELDRLHTFGDSSLSPYYGTFASTRLLTLDGTGGENLAVIGPGFWGCCEVAGYLVGIWRAAGNALEPLASFQLVRQRGKVASVKVEQP